MVSCIRFVPLLGRRPNVLGESRSEHRSQASGSSKPLRGS